MLTRPALALHVTSFFMNWKNSGQNCIRLCRKWTFCLQTALSIGAGIFRTVYNIKPSMVVLSDWKYSRFKQSTTVTIKYTSIDPMHEWRRFWYSFVFIQISPTNLVLEFNFQKNMLPKTRLVGLIECGQKNIKSPPYFTHKVNTARLATTDL